MRLKKISNEVAIADEAIVQIGNEDVHHLLAAVASSDLGRSRICAHRDNGDPVHEMIIALKQWSYIRPHKHLSKSESFHIIQGAVDIVVFDDTGGITNIIRMGEFGSTREFFYRMADPLFHTLLIQSPEVVFHETTNGPFNREETIWAPWAPDPTNEQAAREYMQKLVAAAEKFQTS
jgi:cupin fold WbuC family metalloprotein